MKLKSNFIAAIATGLLGFAIGWQTMAADIDGDRQAQIDVLQADIEKLKVWLKEAQSKYLSVEQSLQQSEESIADLTRLIEQLKADREAEEERLKKLQTERGTLKQTQRRQQRLLNEGVRQLYLLGQQSSLKVLLNSEPTRYSRNLTYLQVVNNQHQDNIQRYQQTVEALDQVESDIELKKNSIQTKLNQLSTKQKARDKEQASRIALLASLDQQIKSNEQSLKQKLEDKKRLQQLVDRVDELFFMDEPFQENKNIVSLKGKLGWPVSGRLSMAYRQRIDGTNQRSDGWLIQADVGTNVKAVHSGRVVFADWLRGFGLLIIVDHGNDYLTLYGRNQALLKSPGDWVKSGEAIAKAGQSGGFSTSGLYFEIRHKGQPANPKRWLGRRG